MLTYELKDHDLDQFIIVNPTTYVTGHFPKEESTQFLLKDFDGYQADFTYTAALRLRDSYRVGNNPIGLIPINTYWSPTDYIGAAAYEVPTNIRPEFCDFKYFDTLVNPLSDLASSGTQELDSFLVDLYNPTEAAENNLVSLASGVQAIRIPAHKFDTLLTDPVEISNNFGEEYLERLGKYYLKVSPKYIETTVLALRRHNHVLWEAWQPNPNLPWDGRRTILDVDKIPFQNTIWNFELTSQAGFSDQRGRLYGSIVEIWDPAKNRIKAIKICGENGFGFNNPNDNGVVVLYPDVIGYDPADGIATAGDILRIYPRESYFKPLFIEINYSSIASVEAALRYMKNDMIRNLETNIVEVYDDNGISLDSNGNITGKVLDAYQIYRQGNLEIRRRIKI